MLLTTAFNHLLSSNT